MKLIKTTLSQVFQNSDTDCFGFNLDAGSPVLPGQYIHAHREGDPMSVPLFPSGMAGSYFTGMPSLKRNWRPGDQFNIRFPLGKGFSWEKNRQQRLLIMSGTENPLRLLPVAGMALADGGEIAYFGYHLPDDLPVEIEIITRDLLPDAIRWADSIIGDVSLENLNNWIGLLGGSATRNIQVLIDTPMVCMGMAECGVCAVKTRHGWKHACTDGPVFPLAELDV